MESIELIFKYTQNEYVKADRQYLIANKTIRKCDHFIASILLLLSIFYLFFSAFSAVSIIFLSITLLVTMLGCYLYFFVPAFKFKQTSKYHGQYTLKFEDAGIKFKTPGIDSELKWSIYSEIWESDDFYFLIQAPRIYTLIPKRAFKGSEDKQTFEEIVLSNINKPKRVL